MALFHLSVTQTKRSAGQSAIASAAYRAGERLYSEYYGEYSDYTRKHPNYKYTSDFDKRNELDLERFLSHHLRLKADAVCEVYEANPSGTTA